MNSNSQNEQEPQCSIVENLLYRKKYANWTTEDVILWLEEILGLP